MADDELNDNCVRYRNHANCTFFFFLLSNILMVHKLEWTMQLTIKRRILPEDEMQTIELHCTLLELYWNIHYLLTECTPYQLWMWKINAFPANYHLSTSIHWEYDSQTNLISSCDIPIRKDYLWNSFALHKWWIFTEMRSMSFNIDMFILSHFSGWFINNMAKIIFKYFPSVVIGFVKLMKNKSPNPARFVVT